MSEDKIAEIKERHLHDERWRNGPSMLCPQSHDDRATLLAEDDRKSAEIEKLCEALEIERLRLAAVDSVAMADTPESAIVARQILPNYRSAALASVERRVNEVIALRAEIERLRAQMQEIRERLYLAAGHAAAAALLSEEAHRRALEGKP